MNTLPYSISNILLWKILRKNYDDFTTICVISLYDSDPYDDEELKYFSGDTIVLTEPRGNGWWMGHIQANPGYRGLVWYFPPKFISSSSSKIFKSAYYYDAENHDELEFVEGEIIQLTGMS